MHAFTASKLSHACTFLAKTRCTCTCPAVACLRCLWGKLVFQCRYDDAYVYQNVFGPLLKLEADYDKSLKQSQARDNVGIRWDMGLNKKHLARVVFSRDDSELRVVPGDELKLKHVLPGEPGLGCRPSLLLQLHEAC